MRITVAGLSHPNSDGTSRQNYLRMCKVNEYMMLVRDGRNPYDPNAIKVCNKNGQQIGFIPQKLTREFASKIDAGAQYSVSIVEITQPDELGFKRCTISFDWL
jgi:hypothetical protein